MKTTLLFVALLSMSQPIAVAQSQLLNRSFETPSIAAGTSSNSAPTSWAVTGSNGFIINGNFSPGYPLPQDGAQYFGVGNSTSLSQSFSVASAGNFTISWFDSSEFNGPSASSPYTASILGSGSNVVSTKDFDANAVALRVWSSKSLTASLTPATYTLRFQGNVAQFGEISLIDNASITAVPEPPTLALVAAGISCLFAIGWRDRKRAGSH